MSMDGRMKTRSKLDICGIFMGINYYIGVSNIIGLLYVLLTTKSQLNTFQLVGWIFSFLFTLCYQVHLLYRCTQAFKKSNAREMGMTDKYLLIFLTLVTFQSLALQVCVFLAYKDIPGLYKKIYIFPSQFEGRSIANHFP